MKKLWRFLPLYSAAAGIACGLMRRSLFAAADSRGLLPLHHPAHTITILLSALLLCLIGFYAVKASNRDFRISCSIPLQDTGCVIAAVFGFFGSFCNYYREDMVLFSVCRGLAAIALLVIAFCRRKRQKAPLLAFALFSLSMMVLCFGQYRQWGQLTQIQEYLFPALSALFLALYSLEYCYLELPGCNYKKAFLIHQAALFTTLASTTGENLLFNSAICLWLFSGLFTCPYEMTLPEDVKDLMDKLENAGFTVYAVGGCVRDCLLGLDPHDYDLCTNASPEQMRQVFQKHQLIYAGEKHGTIGVVLEHNVYEITTYRAEGTYSDNRHPDEVTFVDRIEYDLARRDFTVNAIAYHPKTGYIDPFGGQKDLRNGILRAVGEPEVRFQEDALRILRGVRFACRFGLTPDRKTLQAMKSLSPLMENLAKERVQYELTHILCHMQAADVLTYRDILLQVIPELAPCVDFAQRNPHHKYDVYTHTAYVLGAADAEPTLRWAALLHDAGKPQTFTQDETGTGHFYGHAEKSAQIADSVLRRLKVPNAIREDVVFLIGHHIDTISADKALLRKKLSRYGADNLRRLILLQKADQTGKGTCRPGGSFDKLLQAVEQLEKEEGRLQIKDLAINGHDLMALGFEAGPALGECQKTLLELVLSGEIPNEKNALTEKAKELLP